VVWVMATAGGVRVDAQSPAAEAGPLKAEQFYKNIQVFAGVPAEQVMPAMYLFSSALGVDCGYCHKGEDRVTDIPMKNLARKMVQLTAAINNGTFNGGSSVSCYTCHRGSAHPASALPADDTAHFPTSVPSAFGAQLTPMPSARELIDRYTTALGGTAALDALTTVRATGTATDIDGASFPLEFLKKAPDRRLVIRRRPVNEIPEAYAGAGGWLVDYANHLRQMRLEEVEGEQLKDGVWFPERFAMLADLRVTGIERLDGREAFMVTGRTAYLPVVQLAFDRETGLLRRLVFFTEAAVGRFPLQLDVTGHTTVSGVQMPSRWVVTEIRRRRWSYRLDAIAVNEPIQDARFVMPAEHAH